MSDLEKATSNNSTKLVLIEARRLGRQFMDGFCEIKRLVQDQPTYKTQIVLFNAFKAELFFPDRVIMDLEELIEWNEDCSNYERRIRFQQNRGQVQDG